MLLTFPIFPIQNPHTRVGESQKRDTQRRKKRSKLALWFHMEVDFLFVKCLFREAAYALQAEASVNTVTLYTPTNLYPALAIAGPGPGMRRWTVPPAQVLWATALSEHIWPALYVTFV